MNTFVYIACGGGSQTMPCSCDNVAATSSGGNCIIIIII